MGLRLARTGTKQIDLGDGAFLTVKEELSRREMVDLIKAMPSDVDPDKGLTLAQGAEFQTALFTTFVVGWSLDVEPTLESYLGLDNQSAQTVDEALVNHFGSQSASPEDSKEPRGSRKK